jgi:hypothetical protein
MKTFRLTAPDGVKFFRTRSEVPAVCKDYASGVRSELVVDEVEVQHDKAGLIAALNGTPIVSAPINTWGVTPRGALKAE